MKGWVYREHVYISQFQCRLKSFPRLNQSVFVSPGRTFLRHAQLFIHVCVCVYACVE
jgi:hypothetical protein